MKDILTIAGLALLTYGLDQIYRPAAFIALGTLLLAGGLAAHFKRR